MTVRFGLAGAVGVELEPPPPPPQAARARAGTSAKRQRRRDDIAGRTLPAAISGTQAPVALIDVAEDVEAEQFGPNAWLVEEMYERYRSDPSSVSENWQEFFAD